MTKLKYIDRELSWLDFNERVLQEAQDTSIPIMERLNFLTITVANLDEFFMVRVAGLEEQIISDTKEDDEDEELAKRMVALENKAHEFIAKQYQCLNNSILPTLFKEEVVFLKYNQLNKILSSFVDKYFLKIVFPVLTPLAVDQSRPFPMLANKTLNLAVHLLSSENEDAFAIVQIPSILPRLVELPCENGIFIIFLEDIIIQHINKLFELYSIQGVFTFRITRNGDLSIDEFADNILKEIKKSITKRKRGRPIRLEISNDMDNATKEFLSDTLALREQEMYKISGPIDLTVFEKLHHIYKGKTFYTPAPVPALDFFNQSNMFEAIASRDRMVHHPYESFDSVVSFVAQAAEDENVLAIKQTLYRVSGNSPIINQLIKAAENGKQVTVLVELKARFDEENNIAWAETLEKAGCHVVYGLTGLKIHCKLLLIVRREDEGIRRYVHLGTGNYNDKTAKMYTDIGMFTCREDIANEASALFNILTGYSVPPKWRRLIVAPFNLRDSICELIETEISNARSLLPAKIIIKVNALVDKKIINLLYDAADAGVEINLIIRGICCIVPRKNISVRSIVGQYLEHSRIFYFESGGCPKIFLGSADIMPRNLDRRIEVVFPVLDDILKKRVVEILTIYQQDNVKARILKQSGEFIRVNSKNKPPLNAQQWFAEKAQEEYTKFTQQ